MGMKIISLEKENLSSLSLSQEWFDQFWFFRLQEQMDQYKRAIDQLEVIIWDSLKLDWQSMFIHSLVCSLYPLLFDFFFLLISFFQVEHSWGQRVTTWTIITFDQMLDLVADVPYQKGSVRISEFYWPLSEPNQMLMNTNAQIFSEQPLNELQLCFFSLVVRKHGQ